MSKNVSFLSLNIGNPSIERAKKQCAWLERRSEDVFVLTETKNSEGCSYIEDFFLQYGYDLFTMNSTMSFYVNFPKSQTGDLGTMIISKHPISRSLNFFSSESIYFSRQTECVISIEGIEFNIVGLYVPSRDRSDEKIIRKKEFIDNIEQFIVCSKNTQKIVMGDFNILDRKHIPHYDTFFEWEYNFYDKLIHAGYIDAYNYCNPRKQDYSWVGRTNDGYRYDYCFVSADLQTQILNCSYAHETRIMKLTDHSAISIELKT